VVVWLGCGILVGIGSFCWDVAAFFWLVAVVAGMGQFGLGCSILHRFVAVWVGLWQFELCYVSFGCVLVYCAGFWLLGQLMAVCAGL
jgi:hypothetical protein